MRYRIRKTLNNEEIKKHQNKDFLKTFKDIIKFELGKEVVAEIKIEKENKREFGVEYYEGEIIAFTREDFDRIIRDVFLLERIVPRKDKIAVQIVNELKNNLLK